MCVCVCVCVLIHKMLIKSSLTQRMLMLTAGHNQAKTKLLDKLKQLNTLVHALLSTAGAL